MQGRALTDAETQATRDHLAQVALGVVDREGREACSLRRVAAEAGISRSTPYTYFDDKEALLDAVRVAAVHQLADACEAGRGADLKSSGSERASGEVAVPENVRSETGDAEGKPKTSRSTGEAGRGAGSDVAARLRGVGRAYVAFALEHPALYDLIFEPAEPSEAHRAAISRYRELAEAPLREAKALGITTMEPDRLGHVLWAGTHGLLALHRAGKLRHGLDFEQVLQDLGDTLAFGFVRREAP